jgi:hypothetical protein
VLGHFLDTFASLYLKFLADSLLRDLAACSTCHLPLDFPVAVAACIIRDNARPIPIVDNLAQSGLAKLFKFLKKRSTGAHRMEAFTRRAKTLVQKGRGFGKGGRQRPRMSKSDQKPQLAIVAKPAALLA